MTDPLSNDLASLKISRHEPSEPRASWLKPVMGGALLLILAGAGYRFAAPQLEAKFFKTEVSLTEIVVVSPAEASIELTSTGFVVPQRVSSVSSKASGRVAQVHVVQGQQVKAGDLLFELDPADEQASINAAKSRVAAAVARAATSRAQAETARAELAEATLRADREQSLADQGVSPTGTAQDLKARVTSLERAVKAAEAVAQAAAAEAAAVSAEVKTLETNVHNLKIIAPIDGTVLNKPPEVGEYVGPLPTGVNMELAGVELADFKTLVVETDVPEQRLYLVKVGGPAEIVLDAFPQQRYRGQTVEITPRVDRAKATVMVKVKFVDEAQRVLPDMSARVSFLTAELDADQMKAPPKTVVPSSAVVERAGAKVVFVAENEKVRMVPVQLGADLGRGFELLQGPSPGTKLVANPPNTMADGQKIKERTEP
jgi:RND family efflux transporter MFP subunit